MATSFAAELRVHNDTDHEITVYCSAEWHGADVNGWAGWKQLGVIEGHSAQTFDLKHGRWAIGAQTRRGRILGPARVQVEHDQRNSYHFRE